jgi:P4 family phage/plasmid primase-like protien
VIHLLSCQEFTKEEDWDKPINWITVNNGILDIDSMDFAPHTPKFITRVSIPATYDPTVDCPLIKKFLAEVLQPEEVPVVEEIAGYLLLRDLPLQKAMMFVGEGANGKSTLLNLLVAFVGRENVSNVSLQALSGEKSSFATSQLVGKLANIFADLPQKPLSDTGVFKVLTGGDPISVERKYEHAHSYVNYAKLLFSCNKLPEAADDSYAYFRRWQFIPFKNQFDETRADPKLLEKLTTPEELSGFLNLALAGLARLRKSNQFSHSKSTDEIREYYLRQSSPARAFLESCVELSPTTAIIKRDLYDAFLNFCEDKSLPACSEKAFSMKAAGFAGVKTVRIMANEAREWSWGGIALKNEPRKNQLVVWG